MSLLLLYILFIPCAFIFYFGNLFHSFLSFLSYSFPHFLICIFPHVLCSYYFAFPNFIYVLSFSILIRLMFLPVLYLSLFPFPFCHPLSWLAVSVPVSVQNYTIQCRFHDKQFASSSRHKNRGIQPEEKTIWLVPRIETPYRVVN